MKRILILFAVFLFTTIYAQDMNFEWQSCFGGTLTEDAGYNEKSIVMVSDGFLIVTSSNSDDGDVLSGNNGYDDIWLIKIDFRGNLLWEKTFGGSLNDNANGIVRYSDDIFYILGLTASTDGDVQSGNKGYEDQWLIKINEKGDIIWEKTFGGSKRERNGVLQITDDGDLLVLTSTSSSDGDLEYYNPDSSRHIWFYKVDKNGEIKWSEVFGKYGPNYGSNFLQTSDGGYLLLGSCRGVDGGCECDHHNAGDSYYSDIWVIKLNSDREMEWQNCYGGSYYDVAYDLLEENNQYAILGQSDSDDGQVGFNYSDRDIWFLKISKSGDFQHSKVLGGSGLDQPLALFRNTSSNGYTIINKTDSYNHDVIGNHCGQANYCWKDIWYVEIDSLGEIIYQRCIGAWGDQTPGGMLKLDDGHFIISATASKGEDNFDITCDLHMPYTAGDVWLFEIRDCELYPPTIPSQPIGQDTICTLSYNKTIYTTNITNPQYEEGEWLLEPLEAGELTNKNDTVLINWNTDYEGQATLSVRSTSSCGESEYSEPKHIVVRACVGIGEINKKSLFLYPNPATNQITFELPNINKQSQLQIKDIYGKLITTLIIKPNQSQLIWECGAFASGVYFYEGEISGEVYRGKIVVQ